MKSLLSALIVLAMVSPLCADMVLVQENFDGAGAVAGNPVNGYNGWSDITGVDNIIFSSTTIDSGLSIGTAGNGTDKYPKVGKEIGHVAGADEVYTLTATLLIHDAAEYTVVELQNPTTGAVAYACYGSGGMDCGYWDGANEWDISGTVTLNEAVDLKMVVSTNNINFSQRLHGASEWTDVGSIAQAVSASMFSKVNIGNKNANPGGLADSILLTSGIPEPATGALVASGLLGLLAYAWRKRR